MDATEFERNQIHQYARFTAGSALHWFFFACTSNAAVAGLLVGFPGNSKIISLAQIMALCDLALAVCFWTVLPYQYYRFSKRLEQITPSGSESPFPHRLWTILAVVLGIIFFTIGVKWLVDGAKLSQDQTVNTVQPTVSVPVEP